MSRESIHWNVAGARGSLEVEGNEFENMRILNFRLSSVNFML